MHLLMGAASLVAVLTLDHALRRRLSPWPLAATLGTLAAAMLALAQWPEVLGLAAQPQRAATVARVASMLAGGFIAMALRAAWEGWRGSRGRTERTERT